MNILPDSELFYVKHLSEEDDLSLFKVDKPEGYGLEHYLKEFALKEELSNNARTYLVKEKISDELVAYFTLKSGLITNKTSLLAFDNLTAMEIANFAVNDNYRRYKDVMPHIGRYVFSQFIMPIAKEAQSLIGIEYIYIFALPRKKLIEHYNSMGFERVSSLSLEKYIHRHIKPTYDRGCYFMYLRLE